MFAGMLGILELHSTLIISMKTSLRKCLKMTNRLIHSEVDSISEAVTMHCPGPIAPSCPKFAFCLFFFILGAGRRITFWVRRGVPVANTIRWGKSLNFFLSGLDDWLFVIDPPMAGYCGIQV